MTSTPFLTRSAWRRCRRHLAELDPYVFRQLRRAFQLVVSGDDGDPKSGITWRYLNGMGAFFGWVVPLATLGSWRVRDTFVRAGNWRGRGSGWPPIRSAAHSPTRRTRNSECAAHACRRPVFCILAAIGIVLLCDWADSLRSSRFARIASLGIRSLFAAALIFSTVYFARFYFRGYVHQNSNAWFSGTRALFAAIRENRDGYTRVCFDVRPAWYPLPTFARFYLNGIPLRAINGVNYPSCWLPGTLTAIDSDHPFVRPDFRVLEKISDVDGNGFATISGDR